MNKFSFFFFCYSIIFSGYIFSQELPPIKSFYTDDYSAENQNWAVSQSEDSFIYVANNKGLLEYNGANWQLYETPNETIMRSVHCYNHKVFTGFYMDFGFWKKNEFGNLVYTSIVKNEAIKMLEDEQIWDIIEIDGWMMFKSLQRIYSYNLVSKSIKIIDLKNRVHKLSKVDDVIYFQEDKKGLFKIENGLPKLISNHPILIDNIIVDIFKKNDEILFLTQKNGFYFLRDSKPVKWEIESNKLLNATTIYSARRLKNKNFALGTISEGLIYLNNDGTLNYQINQSSGLSNNTVLAVFEDRENNLWLGLDNGIDCINNTSPFRMYNKKSEFLGTIYTSIVYKDIIYLGTNQGLFYRKIDSNESFKFINKTQGQVWSLQEVNNTLFCGHDSGTFIVTDATVKHIFSNQGTWKLIKMDENTILQGSYDGLYVLKKEGLNWVLHNKIEGFENSSKDVVKINNTNFFINHEYKGVFKLTIDKELKKVIKLKKETSIQKGTHSSIISYQHKILYANKSGVFVYNPSSDSFKRDSIYSKLIHEESFISGKLIYNSSDNKLWFFSKDQIKYLSPGKLSNIPEIHIISVSESIPKAASGYENIIHLKNDMYLIGTSNGYIQIDSKQIKEPADFKVYINSINNFATDVTEQKVNLFKESNFSYKNNNLEFFYSVPNFNAVTTTKYQYILTGLNKNWSVSSKSNSVLFKNLSYGNYTFKVRAIIAGKISKNVASITFNINKPWYISNVFILIYTLLVLFSFFFVHIASKRYYKKQREDLLEKAKKELELKELESSQQIIKLNNEKLRNDIENKSKELATSTMNIIKKNEFLNTIKTELVSGGEKTITKVVKIIDKNLNNTDDWKMFQEAFDNADKKFLKKVKSKHPDLTPNDLRLCAYLRLNLSSKEIAPLLNISPRSVEVKRYRLRKKMDLPHDSNLTNYILEI